MPPVQKITDYLDARVGLRETLRKNFTGYLLPRNINIWYALGSVLLALFVIQIVTGILLLVYYIPSTAQAFESVERIMNEASFGWLFRSVHAVGANVIIIALLLHMFSVLYMGAYKRPRELTWVAGFLLFMVSLGMCFTGYLLPWSQLSFWATTVATRSAGVIPVIGDTLLRFLRGGTDVGQRTLGLFFALHVAGLPLLLGLLVLTHLFLVRRIGVSTPPFGPDYQPQRLPHEGHADGIPFFPNYATKDMAVISLFLALLAGVVFFAPWFFLPDVAYTPADPFTTPVGIKPEWYFLAAYQTLRLLPSETAGLAVQAAAIGFLFFLPFIDRSEERRPVRRPLFLCLFIIGIMLSVGLTIWGHFS